MLRRLVVLVAAIFVALILYRWISQERLQYFAPRDLTSERAGFAAIRAALRHENQNAPGESWATGCFAVASQFFRLPDDIAVAASADASQSAASSGRHGRRCRRFRRRPDDGRNG